MRKSYKALKELVASIVNMGWMPVDAILVWEMPAVARALRGGRGQRAHDRAARHPAGARARAHPAAEGARRQDHRSRLHQGDGRSRRPPGGGDRGHGGAGGAPGGGAHGGGAGAHAAAPAGRAPHQPRAAVEAAGDELLHLLALPPALPRDLRARGEAAARGGAAARDGRHGEPQLLEGAQGIQAACRFSRFRAAFEDRLPKGERFDETDQNYFLYLFEPGYARDQFGLSDSACGWSARRRRCCSAGRSASRARARARTATCFRAPRTSAPGTRSRATTTGTRRTSRAGSTCAVPTRPARSPRWTWTGARTARTARRSRRCWRWWRRCARWRSTRCVAAKDEIRPAMDELLAHRQGVPGDARRARRPGPAEAQARLIESRRGRAASSQGWGCGGQRRQAELLRFLVDRLREVVDARKALAVHEQRGRRLDAALPCLRDLGREPLARCAASPGRTRKRPRPARPRRPASSGPRLGASRGGGSAKMLSWYGQNRPCSCAHSPPRASAAGAGVDGGLHVRVALRVERVVLEVHGHAARGRRQVARERARDVAAERAEEVGELGHADGRLRGPL